MPPRTRRAAARKPLTLGFAGSGTLDTKAITALLDDLTEGVDVAAIYVPVTDELFTDAIADVVEWANKNNLPYVTLSDEDASKKSDLKSVVDDAADDYDAGDDAIKGIIELLAGDEAEPVEDGRLLMFLDPESDADADAFEEAADLDVPAFDLCDQLSPISVDDDGEPEQDEDEPAEEETPEPVPATSRRRKAAEAEAEERETVVEGGSFGTAEDLNKLHLVELKKKAKAADAERWTTESLRGVKKPELVAFLSGQEGQDAPDEAQAAPAPRRGRVAAPATASEAVAPVEAEDEGDDPTEAVFERLRGQRETAARIGAGVSAVLRGQLELDEEEQQRIDVAAGALGAALMVFAEVVIVEVRKPKSPGRPRKDGTEAKPRPPKSDEPEETEVVEEGEKPRTRRRRSS